MEYNNEPAPKKQKVVTEDAANKLEVDHREENILTDCKDRAPSDALQSQSSAPEKTGQSRTKTESKGSLTNGSGQKLESIIGRLCSDKSGSPHANENQEAIICKADACTQTVPDFIKIVKCLVLKRMKQLEQSLIGGAVADSALNGKLAELHKENKELREKTKTLQDKIEVLIRLRKIEDKAHSVKPKEVTESIAIQGLAADGGTSPIRRQSAVVSPYNVHGMHGEIPAEMLPQIDSNRLRKEMVGRHISQFQSPSSSNYSQLSQNTPVLEQGPSSACLSTIPYHPGSHQGPQVKYVPLKVQGSQVSPGGPGAQNIRIPMHKIPQQRQHGSNGDLNDRMPGQQVIYTTQPVQVTGPRMSTLPPQPLQVNQQHVTQRSVLSPNSQIRMSQTAIRAGAPIRLQGPAGQTVHYVPQGIIPGYMTQVQPNFNSGSHRAQGPNVLDYRGQAPLAGRNMLHHVNDFRIQPGQLPPPPYQNLQRNQAEPPTPPKLQVNITVSGNGIVLSWDFEKEPSVNSPAIESYHLFASQDSPSPPTTRSEWKKIGVVKALPLPMACTLTQFVSGNSYHFAVLAIDIHAREGPMSNPCTVKLNK